jgi:hypothetical protein
MRRTYATSQFVVIDDFLSPADHLAAWRAIQDESFEPVPLARGVFRVADGQALRSTITYLWSDHHALPPRDRWIPRLRGVGPHEAMLAAFVAAAAQEEPLLGAKGRDWGALLLTPCLYRRGDAISWHTDGFSYTGALAYYPHLEWNCLWGGELLFVDERTRKDPRHFARKYLLDNPEENERLLDPGVGRFVFPRPNRLVLIAAGNEHMLAEIRGAAGNNVRASFAGFFVKAELMDQVLTTVK